MRRLGGLNRGDVAAADNAFASDCIIHINGAPDRPAASKAGRVGSSAGRSEVAVNASRRPSAPLCSSSPRLVVTCDPDGSIVEARHEGVSGVHIDRSPPDRESVVAARTSSGQPAAQLFATDCGAWLPQTPRPVKMVSASWGCRMAGPPKTGPLKDPLSRACRRTTSPWPALRRRHSPSIS
jgi:hypothetical protein